MSTEELEGLSKASDPNTEPAELLRLALWFPKEVLENPVLDLIALEDPNLYLQIATLAKVRGVDVERAKEARVAKRPRPQPKPPTPPPVAPDFVAPSLGQPHLIEPPKKKGLFSRLVQMLSELF